MKNNEFLQDAIGAIDEELIKEAKEEKKPALWKKWIPAAACLLLLISAIPISLMIGNFNNPSVSDDTDTSAIDTSPIFDNNGREIWVDNRKYKDGTDAYGEEIAYEWAWKYLDMHEKYWLIDVEDKNSSYYFINLKVPEELLGDFLGDMIAYGYDDFGEGGRYEINCIAYSIKGAPDNNAMAVKLEGTDEYWIYHIRKAIYQSPAYLGELISSKNLKQTYQFLNFEYDHDNDATTWDVKYDLSEECSNHIWSLLEKCQDAEFMESSISNPYKNIKYVQFNNTSIPLGRQGVSITIYANGVLATNVLSYYTDYFYIGKNVAAEIIEYALENGEKAPESTNKWVAGTITEIGENYFKINDAPMMENEEDGIEFVVNTTDIKILRYFMSGILKVGDTAIVRYNGNIYADEPTVINGAYSIDECHIYGGDAYVPE
ncbi:MAG: hypothetical protein IJY39_07460 [Clostridia bacterium]|nr:hypothetical protein [Clostridia bacterium]